MENNLENGEDNSARLVIENAKRKKCPADTINEFELYESPWLLEDVSKLLARGNAIQPITGLFLVTLSGPMRGQGFTIF